MSHRRAAARGRRGTQRQLNIQPTSRGWRCSIRGSKLSYQCATTSARCAARLWPGMSGAPASPDSGQVSCFGTCPELGQGVSSDLRTPRRRSGWLFPVLEKTWLRPSPVPEKRSALDRCQCGVRPPEISGGLAAGGNHNFSLHLARARITDSVTVTDSVTPARRRLCPGARPGGH